MENNINIQALSAVSPIDGRYAAQTEVLRNYFSEGAFMRYRVRVEVEYFIALTHFDVELLADFPAEKEDGLRRLYREFSPEDMLVIKNIEKVTNHDVKAVEYFLKQKLEEMGLGRYKEMVHFGLTSQDINNTAQPLMLKEALQEVVLPEIEKVLGILEDKALEWRAVSMLARTHGQPASPTILGKEIRVFIERIYKQLDLLNMIPYSAKFGGATGNLNAHYVAYPEKDRLRQPFRKRRVGTGPFADHDADRALRQYGRDVRRHQAHQHDISRHLPRYVDVYLDGVFQAED